jgi:hypothetical protein
MQTTPATRSFFRLTTITNSAVAAPAPESSSVSSAEKAKAASIVRARVSPITHIGRFMLFTPFCWE